MICGGKSGYGCGRPLREGKEDVPVQGIAYCVDCAVAVVHTRIQLRWAAEAAAQAGRDVQPRQGDRAAAAVRQQQAAGMGRPKDDSVVGELTCVECQRPFPHRWREYRRGRTPRFCSPSCRSAAGNRSRAARRVVEALVCTGCGRAFARPNDRRHSGLQTWCSRECQIAHQRAARARLAAENAAAAGSEAAERST